MWAVRDEGFFRLYAILQFCGSAVAAAVVAVATGCDKLGLGGDSPTAPTGPPAAGSTIIYTAVGASDANGVGSSAECLFLTECPNGMGYVPVTVRALKAQGFTVTNLNLGIPTAVIGRDFQTLGAQYGRTIVGNFIDNEMPFVQHERDGGDDLRRASTKSTRSPRRSAAAPAAAIRTATSTRRCGRSAPTTRR